MTPTQKRFVTVVLLTAAALIVIFGVGALVGTSPPSACKECPQGVNVCQNGNLTEIQVDLAKQEAITIYVIPHPSDYGSEASLTDLSTFTSENDKFMRVKIGTIDRASVGLGIFNAANPVGGNPVVTIIGDLNLQSNQVIMIALGNSTRGIPIYNYGGCPT